MESSNRKRSRSSNDCLVDESLVLLDMELQRSRVAYNMSKELHEACKSHGIDSMSLFVGFVFETIAARCAYEQRNGTSGTRKWLHAHLDPGKGLLVQRAANAQALESRGTLDKIKYESGGIVGVVSCGGETIEAPIEEWEACEPIPMHLDPMLPCGEVVEPHRSPQSVYQLCLSKLCEADKVTKSKSYNAKKRIAWEIADKATLLAADARHQLHSPACAPKATPRTISVVIRKDETSGEIEATVSLDGRGEGEAFPFEVAHKLVAWQYFKLRRFYCAKHQCNDSWLRNDQCALRVFHIRLFTMLQRYTGVTGLFSRIEAGWHAAVPPEPFDYLRNVMGAEAEGFASPLNARIHRFCSAFADTDAHFGSFGPFHQFFPTKGCFEVGPPYDHEVIRIAFDHAIECLDSPLCDGPLCFVFIIPESQRDSGLKVREVVERSKYRRVSEVIAKAEAKYIDGFQHRPGENRLIVISCDTRIIILQNDASAAMLPAHKNFAEFKEKWVNCTSVIDRGQDEEMAKSSVQA